MFKALLMGGLLVASAALLPATSGDAQAQDRGGPMMRRHHMEHRMMRHEMRREMRHRAMRHEMRRDMRHRMHRRMMRDGM